MTSRSQPSNFVVRTARQAMAACLSSRQDHQARPARYPTRSVAAVVTEYRHNSHADVIVSRLLLTDMLDGTGRDSPLKLVSLYTDQKTTDRHQPPAGGFAPVSDQDKHRRHTHPGHGKAGGRWRLDRRGTRLVSRSRPRAIINIPSGAFWDETVKVFRQSGRVVPVFIDKHLSDNWKDAKAIYDTARELKIPLMAGSSVPGTWRHPPADVVRDARVAEIVALTYGSTDAYGFHGLEAVQSLAEQRQGGETGVARCNA